MLVKPSDTVSIQFTAQNATTGAAANADSLPTGVLVQNGADTAETVTVTNIATGVYKASVTIPSGYSAGDEVQLRIAATVSGVAGKAVIWSGEVDTARASETYARIGAPVGASIAADINAVPTAAEIDTQLSGVHGAGAWDASAATVFPAGAVEFTYTVTDQDSMLPIEGVEVWFSTDAGGLNNVWKGDTDAFGVARDVNGDLPMLDAGSYFVWRQKGSYIFQNPDTEVVS